MGVLTSFFRVAADTLETLEADPELMDWILGYTHNTALGEKLGFRNGTLPPHLNIDKAWDEILIVLSGTERTGAYRALDIPLWEEYDGCEEIRLFTPAEVRRGLALLEKLKIDELRADALRRELRTFSGEPIDYLLDYALGHFEHLRDFWRETAESGEGIISETG
jgi:hypothetical protein